MPLAVERFDLRAHDIVISVSHAVAEGMLTRSDQLHVSYVCTPVRYAWDLREDTRRRPLEPWHPRRARTSVAALSSPLGPCECPPPRRHDRGL